MIQRLLAPPASRHCLDLDALAAWPSDPAILGRELAAAREGADARLADAFTRGEPVAELVRARAWVVEQLVLAAWGRLRPEGRGLELAAVGGFGRGELHPHSDMDLLVLRPEGEGQDEETEALETFIRVLWDAGLHPGSGVRSVAECEAEAAADVTVATNLMEARLIDGDGELYRAMKMATDAPALWPAADFFTAKMAEQDERHAAFEDTAYNLEPNIKEGPGGLRDIQMIAWVTRRHFGTTTLHGLVEHGFLGEREYQDLVAGRDRLWAIRWALHSAAGRAEERLLFEYQRRLAADFGHGEIDDSNRAVEQFMQGYYRTVMQLERLNERLLQSFDEELLAGRADLPSGELDDRFRIRHGYLEIRDPQSFVREPALIMRIFPVMADHPEIKGVRGTTIRLVREHLYLIDDEFRNDPEVQSQFLGLLRRERGIYTQLERMNRYGVLGAFLPPFGQITGRMQFDLFHVYTVDQHTLFVVRNLRRFAYGKYSDVFAHADEVFPRIERPEVLYLAALFHDIAKGRGGDHSELGAGDARTFLAPLDMPAEDKRLVEWLVRHHLLLSMTAQRQDISDPDVVNRFAERIGEQRYLDHLYVLTVADIAATSPRLWNSWKDSLIWDLYVAAGHALRRGRENPLNRELIVRETRADALSALIHEGVEGEAVEGLWRALPDEVFLRLDADQLVWTTRAVIDHPDTPLAVTRRLADKGISELFVRAVDVDGLFAIIARELDRMRLNVLSARVLTTADGHGWDLFQLMDATARPLNDGDAGRLCAALTERVDGEPRPLRRGPIPRRLQAFMSAADVGFDQAGGMTVVEVVCTDRPGLLSAIAEAMVAAGVRLHDARIVTFGQRVEDSFRVTDAHDRPLDETGREALEAQLRERLDTPLERTHA